ncbi:hypothetical protein ASZ78_007441, partial [Callipepla squamata]
MTAWLPLLTGFCVRCVTENNLFLFTDAVREVRKYSAIQVNEKVANVNANAIDHIQMKLFRSQRNLYISGFSLFLWLVLRRTVTLLTQLAKTMASHAALETQVNDATEAAKKYMSEKERLQEALNEKGSSGNKEAAEAASQKLRKEIEELKAELKKTSNGNPIEAFLHFKVKEQGVVFESFIADPHTGGFKALYKANNEVTAVQKQYGGLKREYDRLMNEYEQLQNASSETEDKKD